MHMEMIQLNVRKMPELDFDGHNTLYATHGIHAYAAKCPPQLVRYAVRYYSKRGDTVLDPMVGSGTTLVESRLLGRNGIGYDFDPLARLIAEVKSTPLEDSGIRRGYDTVIRNVESLLRDSDFKRFQFPDFHNRDYWFEDYVLRYLSVLSHEIREARMPGAVRKFLWVAFSSLILSKTSVANARDGIHSRHHHWQHDRPPDVLRRFKSRVMIMRRQMADFKARCKQAPLASVRCSLGDARQLDLDNESIDLIFTSPPYATALDYTRAHFLAVPWMREALGFGLAEYLERSPEYIGSERGRLPNELSIDPNLAGLAKTNAVLEELNGTSGRLAKRIHRYFVEMRRALAEMARVLKPKKHVVLVVCPSHLRKIQIPTHEILAELGSSLGLNLSKEYTRVISERRRLLPYVKPSFGNRMDLEYILIFQKC